MSRKYIALVPAYEPESMLIDLLGKLREAEFGIVVVNDGSGDGFAEIFEKAAVYADKVLVHDVNKGKGAAIKTGLSYIQEHYAGDSIIVTVDADGQHCVEDAIKLCDIVSERRGTLLLGSRSFTGSLCCMCVYITTNKIIVF